MGQQTAPSQRRHSNFSLKVQRWADDHLHTMDSSAAPSAQLTRFYRQYLQLERPLQFPDDTVLREDDAQAFLYQRLFKPGAVAHPPPIRYQVKVAKELFSRLESCIEDWEAFVSSGFRQRPMLAEPGVLYSITRHLSV